MISASDHYPNVRATNNQPNLDPEEVRRFEKLATEWWDPNGKFRPLHQIGPARMQFIRNAVNRHFGLDARMLNPLENRTALDIGCGGGLISEPLRRLGAEVTGIDPSETNIAIARNHATAQELDIDYRACQVEDIVEQGLQYDVVVCLEVVEHVPDVRAFIASCAKTVKPGGVIILSTLNRTFKAWALAIIGAEYVLGWLPRGTHQWERFVTPDELKQALAANDLTETRSEGMTYNPLQDEWRLSPDINVNYLMSATRQG